MCCPCVHLGEETLTQVKCESQHPLVWAGLGPPLGQAHIQLDQAWSRPLSKTLPTQRNTHPHGHSNTSTILHLLHIYYSCESNVRCLSFNAC